MRYYRVRYHKKINIPEEYPLDLLKPWIRFLRNWSSQYRLISGTRFCLEPKSLIRLGNLSSLILFIYIYTLVVYVVKSDCESLSLSLSFTIHPKKIRLSSLHWIFREKMLKIEYRFLSLESWGYALKFETNVKKITIIIYVKG